MDVLRRLFPEKNKNVSLSNLGGAQDENNEFDAIQEAVALVRLEIEDVKEKVFKMNANCEKVQNEIDMVNKNVGLVQTDVIKVGVDISLFASDPDWSAILTDVPLLLVNSRSLDQHTAGTILVIKQVFTPDDVRLSSSDFDPDKRKSGSSDTERKQSESGTYCIPSNNSEGCTFAGDQSIPSGSFGDGVVGT